MSNFTEHQIKIWKGMITLIDQYKKGLVIFPQLVNGLQGLLDAGDYKGESIRKEWYSFWQKLEIANALSNINEDTKKDIDEMRSFLKKELKNH